MFEAAAAKRASEPARLPTQEGGRDATASPFAFGASLAGRLALSGRPVQPKLEIGAVDDPLEREADAVSEQVMRMPDPGAPAEVTFQAAPYVGRACAACEEETLQRREADGGESAAPEPDVESHLAGMGSGSPLPDSTRAYLEPRFGEDFSDVRVHSDGRAAESASSIHALAYTVGNRIVFNRGQYSPETGGGMRLLAHELTHVVQQSPGSGGAPAAQPRRVQRAPFFFAPALKTPDWNLVHAEILPLFLKPNAAINLFIEAPIPGATRKGLGAGSAGRADFYTATPARTIGLNFDAEPSYMPAPGLEFSGGAYRQDTQSAPRGAPSSPKARRIDQAAEEIGIGDLKPGYSSESFLGIDQVGHYKKGITTTATALNAWLAANPAEGAPSGSTWKPRPSTLKSLTIPPEITYPGGTRFQSVPLGLYESQLTGVRKIMDAGLQGRLYVYKDKTAGVWSYEWIPDSIPVSTGNSLVNTVLDRLNKVVIPAIKRAARAKAKGGKKAAPKRMPGAMPAPVRRRPGRVVRRFSNAEWKTNTYGPWDTEAKKFLGDEKEVGKARVAETAVELQERSGTNLGIPAEVKERGKGLGKIQHWHRFGGLYGALRERFDFLIVKFEKFAAWVKAKVKKLTKPSAGVKFGSWVKAAAQAIFKIFKMVGAWAVTETVDRLIESLEAGISANLEKLADMATPEGVKSKVEEFEEMKAKYEEIIKHQEEELSKFFFGDNLELFEKLAEFEKVAETVSTIVSLVEWGVRLLACASPPAIGCLWNLAISALQAAFAILMQTCWFTKKVYQPVISKVDMVGKFPAKVAAEIVTAANSYLPVPEGFDPLFAPIDVDVGTFKADCDDASDAGARLTPERQAILDLREELGEAKFQAFLEMMAKRAAGPWVLVTPERIAALKEPLKKIDEKTLKELAADKTKGAPVELVEFLTGISQYTEREKKTAKTFHEQAAAAAAAKVAAGKGDQSGATGTAGPAPAAGGGGAGGGGAPEEKLPEGVKVISGSDHTMTVAPENRYAVPGIFARVVDASREHGVKQPATITADIFVKGVHTYRVKDIKVRSVFAVTHVSTPPVYTSVYYLTDGLALDIGGQRVVWEQMSWSIIDK